MTPERLKRLTDVLNKRQPDITVVLENVFDPHNVSAVMRTCDAIGIQEVYILNDRIPPHKKWGYRSSSTAAKWLTVHQFTNAESCFRDIRKKYDQVLTSHLTEDARDLYSLDLSGSLALVFGNETFGVSANIQQYSDGHFVIPQVGIIKSLNISVACAVTLYEAFRQRSEQGYYNSPRLKESIRNEVELKWGIKKSYEL